MRRLPPLVACAAIAAALTSHLSAQAPHVVKVVGERHQLALRSDGSVVGWGPWVRGQLGPVGAIVGTKSWTSGAVVLELPGKAIDVAAGDDTSYAVLDDGTAWAWGSGREGELGTGPAPSLPLLATSTPAMEYRGAERPVKVAADTVTAIVAAGRRAAAILRDGTVVEWPRSRTAGGTVVFAPVPVPRLAGVTQVALGWSHALALTADGRVWAWGNNRYGALGIEPKAEGWILDPVEVAGLTGIAAIAAAGDVSLALTRDGSVWVWGSNGQGQFGNGARASHPSAGTVSTPQRVPGISNAVGLTAGMTGRHVFVLLKDGTLRGWGNTDYGQLGAGLTATFQLTPVTPKIGGVKAVFAVGNSTFAVKADRTFWGWGTGDRGRWPFETNTKVPTPVTLP
jgi:alpha-tubulin suppressor-like RCC1 family protein